MRSTLLLLAACAMLTGCHPFLGTVNPADLRSRAKPISTEGAGSAGTVAPCLMHGLERESPSAGLQADLRTSSTGGQEVVGRMDGDAMMVLDVLQTSPERVRVDYYLEPGLIFRGLLEGALKRAIATCLGPTAYRIPAHALSSA